MGHQALRDRIPLFLSKGMTSKSTPVSHRPPANQAFLIRGNAYREYMVSPRIFQDLRDSLQCHN